MARLLLVQDQLKALGEEWIAMAEEEKKKYIDAAKHEKTQNEVQRVVNLPRNVSMQISKNG